MKKPGKDAVELADALHSAAVHLLRRVRKQDVASGIGPAQLSALSVLVFGGSMSLGDLAAAEQVRPPTMVRIVRALAQEGLLVTKPDKQDRRRLVISATARGRELMLRARQRRVQALAELIAGINVREQEQLREAVKVIRELLKRGSAGP
ncbi:MAG: MarR family transcriptional regulator [Candidatus Korobacteraceae bacterium]